MANYPYEAPRADGRMACVVCPRRCRLRDGQSGMCGVRRRDGEHIRSTVYGLTTGLCLDPIEKKPLYHFLPGSRVASFGTVGCNLACKFCQNWHISRTSVDRAALQPASPSAIVTACLQAHAESVAFTYNDPTVFIEYAADTARLCREKGVRTVAVTAGYIEPGARADLFADMDAANVDLKAISDAFYRRLCGAAVAPVLDTLRYLRHETTVWLELTNLLVPGWNDGDGDVEQLARWVVQELGADVPMHFSAFHPAWRMASTPATPAGTVRRARRIALDAGLEYVYTGNIVDPGGQGTRCVGCGALLVARNGYAVSAPGLLPGGRCAACGAPCAGVFASGMSDQ